MYNYSARPWIAIGVYILLLASLFYIRKPLANGPVDIIPLWIIAVLFGFVSFFLAAYIVDYLMLFSSKFILHEVYQFRDSTSSSPYLEPLPAPPSTNNTEEPFLETSEENDFSSMLTASSSGSRSSSSSSSSSSSLRPRRDANQFLMF